MTFENGQQPPGPPHKRPGVPDSPEQPDSAGVPAQEPSAREKATARNKKQAWLYIVIGLLLGVVAVLGLVADDRGVLDGALLVLAIINLAIGVLAVRRPEPRPAGPIDE